MPLVCVRGQLQQNSSSMMFATYRFGGKGSTVANRGYQSYWRPGTGPPLAPSSFPPIPAHGAAVPTLISGNWTNPTVFRSAASRSGRLGKTSLASVRSRGLRTQR